MALADAQTLAIRKLLSKAAYDNSLTPGPPLPKSHPSPGLIAKLYLECEDLYASARALVKSQGKTKGHENEEVSAELRHYLADEAQLCGALAHKWLGVDAGEQGGGDKCGVAIAFLLWAKTELEDLKDGGKGLIGRAKDLRERRKSKVATELASTTLFWKYYKNMNDTVCFPLSWRTPDAQFWHRYTSSPSLPGQNCKRQSRQVVLLLQSNPTNPPPPLLDLVPSNIHDDKQNR